MKHVIKKIKTMLKVFTALSLLSAFTGVYGDDTEVFFSTNVSKPNLLFVLDTSGSMILSRVAGSGDSNNTVNHTMVPRYVAHRDDDAEQAASGGTQLRSDRYLDLGYDGYDFRAPQRVGLRFFDLDIPAGALIINAYIQFEVRDTGIYTRTPINLKVYAEANTHALRFDDNNKIDSRTYLQKPNVSPSEINAIAWDNVPVWQSIGDRGVEQRTPDLTELVQSIINLPSWDQQNNAIVFVVEGVPGETGTRVAASIENGINRAPSLHVEYTTVEAGADKTRLEVMQIAIKRVLETAPDNVNVGIMKFSGQKWNNVQGLVSGVGFPVSDINALVEPIVRDYKDRDNLPNPSDIITVREYLSDISDSWKGYNGTPIVDSLYEAALYYRGEKMHFGNYKNNTEDVTSDSNYFNLNITGIPVANGSHPATYAGGAEIGDSQLNPAPNYISPINSSCQSNYILLMTDGEPTAQKSFADSIRGTGTAGTLAREVPSCESNPEGLSEGECGKELTHYISTHDNSDEEGEQIIDTFTIGFGNGLSDSARRYLKSLQTIVPEGEDPTGEGYFNADSVEELAAAFKKILDSVAEPSGTLASPGYSVNVKSGLEHEKDIYIPVFDRENTSRWNGNLKKFRIVVDGNDRVIKGKNNTSAVDALGGFTADAWDYWSESSTADGIDIQKGGVASKLDNPAVRNIYSNITTNLNLSANENKIVTNNSTLITNSLLGIPSTATEDFRKKLIRFIRGWKDGIETNGVARKHMGDMLHAEPLIITYQAGADDGTGKEQYIFAGTNEGYLHVFDTATGEEKFAFMPKELLKIIEPQFRNEGTAEDHKYGVDGNMTYWKTKVNGVDKIYLYFGLRRGGTSYYALDVTDIDQPKLLWTVSADDYPTMGQSWSSPYLARIRYSGGTCTDGTANCREVMIVSGGYDEDEDRDGQSASTPITADVGNDIFMFDAVSGAKLWSLRDNIGNTSALADLTSSIPGGVRMLDTNRNGLIDRLYFADTGGDVWRLELDENTDSTNDSKLIKMASLGSGGRQNSRKFYNEPDVSSMKLNGKRVFVISVGSGFRAHPMDESISDKFFMIIDDSPYESIDLDNYSNDDVIIMDDLANITISGAVGATAVATEGTFGSGGKKGWVVDFPESGEKVLGTSITYNGSVVFTTLLPKPLLVGEGIDQCAAPSTQGRLYAIDILSGKAGQNLNKDNDTEESVINATDIAIIVSKGEIPGKPQIVFNSLEVNDDGTGSHIVDIRIGKKKTQATEYDAFRLESVYWSDPFSKQ